MADDECRKNMQFLLAAACFITLPYSKAASAINTHFYYIASRELIGWWVSITACFHLK